MFEFTDDVLFGFEFIPKSNTVRSEHDDLRVKFIYLLSRSFRDLLILQPQSLDCLLGIFVSLLSLLLVCFFGSDYFL